MPIHDVAFWFCGFFLIGVLLISFIGNLPIVLIIVLLGSIVFLFYKKPALAGLFLFAAVGAVYYQIFSFYQQKNINIVFDKSIEFTGIIEKIEQSSASQKLVINLSAPYSGKVQVNAKRYPSLKYGDGVLFNGIISHPSDASKNYYAKEDIGGTSNFPTFKIISENKGSAIKASLLRLKNKIISIFEKTLPPEKSAFLAGLTLGEREDFSKDFQNKMSLSGTTHLIALSGYNITIIAIAIMALFSFLPSAISFWVTLATIILFVLMTGAEASIVRAATMGIFALMAQKVERHYSLRNSITIAAFLMIIFNPRILVFDVGFQLSFMALFGLIVLPPIITKIFKIENQGILSWKENFVNTLSAQIFVLPILASSFGYFSLTSFLANILILPAVPLTMGLGFLMGGVGLVSGFLAQIIGLVANLLLLYMLFIIDLFAKIAVKIDLTGFGVLAFIFYYVVLIVVIFYANRKTSKI